MLARTPRRILGALLAAMVVVVVFALPASAASKRDKKNDSVLDLPLNGVLTTLGISVLIGATAGKVYVSLLGHD
ncbi:MAG TPA: hypothetical protein VFK89_07395 [Actinomycetota bacterium]|nr:hypothetical protein [Actinomycetota bacterium]